MLDFVNDGPIQTANEAAWIRPSRFGHRPIVGNGVGPTRLLHLSDKRDLAGMARPQDQNHACIRERLPDPMFHRLSHDIERRKSGARNYAVLPYTLFAYLQHST